MIERTRDLRVRDAGRGARVAVTATFFCHGLYFASWTAHIPAVQARLHLSISGLGAVLLGAPLGVVSALAVAARLLPRVGSRRAIRVALVGYCLTGPLVGLAPIAAFLFASLLVWGAFLATLDAAMNTQGIAVEQAQSRRLMPGLHGAWSLGSFAGAGIGAAAVGAGISLSVQMALLMVPILLLAGALSLRMLDDSQPVPRGSSARPRRWSLGVFSRPILMLAAIAFAGLLCEGAAGDWAAVYLRQELHTSRGFAGLGFTAFSLAMVTVRLAGNNLLDRARPQRALPALTLISTVGFSIGLIAFTPALTIAGFACLGAGLALIVPSMFTAAGRVPSRAVGSALSAVAALSYTGFVCGPPLIGALSGALSLRVALVLLPVLTGGMTLLTLRAPALV